MNAPDKIYLNKYMIRPGMLYPAQYPADTQEFEYIRKDVLLEWLRKEYETMSWYYEKMKHVTGCIGDTGSSGKAEAYEKVINKIKSL